MSAALTTAVISTAPYIENTVSLDEVRTIIDFYEILLSTKEPTEKDFLRLFGEESWEFEAGLEDHVYEQAAYNSPEKYPSAFLVRLKKHMHRFYNPQEGMLLNLKPKIEYYIKEGGVVVASPKGKPLNATYTMRVGNTKLEFIFSRFPTDEKNVFESVLIDGKSVYDLVLPPVPPGKNDPGENLK